jgi:hypothetical protein
MRRRLILLIVVVGCAGAFLLAALFLPALPRSQPFDLSRTLSTGTTTSDGQANCGPNETIRVSFPSDGIVSFWMAQNLTNASVNLWTYSDWSYAFVTLGPGGSLNGTFSSDDYTFVFQACGSTPTVSLGFWGITNYLVPLL